MAGVEVGNDGAVTYCIQKSLVLFVFFWVEHVVTAGQVLIQIKHTNDAETKLTYEPSLKLTIPGRTEYPRSQVLCRDADPPKGTQNP